MICLTLRSVRCCCIKLHRYISTPLYYVNGKPHLGHMYTTLASDVMARFWRLQGDEVFFVTGTDEHGQKISQTAMDCNLSPLAYVNQFNQDFRAMMKNLNISFDEFIRTTEERHCKAAQDFWKRLEASGSIYKGYYEGWYATQDEAYYHADDIVNGKAPTGAAVKWVKEECYFFRLSQWEKPLLDWYERMPESVQPRHRRQEVLQFVRGGLKDLAISRSTLTWGIPVPGDAEHVIYVWVEALTGYLTSLGYPDVDSEKFQNFWPSAFHMMGKDILRFHAVYWPAFLMAARLPLPRTVYAHGWWLMDREKMSKSLNNTLNWSDVAVYGTDALRYFLLRRAPFGEDGVFCFSAFAQHVNVDLANDLGNALHRVLS